MSPHDLPTAEARLRELAERWAGAAVSERAAFQSWLLDFCDALGVDKPVPPSPDYQFELPVRVVDQLGRASTNFIDCRKAGHFALEAKATDAPEENDGPLRRAYGQVRNYAGHTPGPSPVFLMTVDVPHAPFCPVRPVRLVRPARPIRRPAPSGASHARQAPP